MFHSTNSPFWKLFFVDRPIHPSNRPKRLAIVLKQWLFTFQVMFNSSLFSILSKNHMGDPQRNSKLSSQKLTISHLGSLLQGISYFNWIVAFSPFAIWFAFFINSSFEMPSKKLTIKFSTFGPSQTSKNLIFHVLSPKTKNFNGIVLP